jgi:hypothetical protein
MDHLKLLRRQKKLRREEEERWQHRAELLVPSTGTARNEARPDPAARLFPSNSGIYNVARPAYKAAATTTQQLESQKKRVAKVVAPVSTLPLSPEQPE